MNVELWYNPRASCGVPSGWILDVYDITHRVNEEERIILHRTFVHSYRDKPSAMTMYPLIKSAVSEFKLIYLRKNKKFYGYY